MKYVILANEILKVYDQKEKSLLFFNQGSNKYFFIKQICDTNGALNCLEKTCYFVKIV